MLGYSSIAHSGYVAALLASGSALAPEAVLLYLAAYAPALLIAFCAASLVAENCGIDDLRALVWRQPIAGGALAVALVSLAGLPVSAGFFGKFFLFAGLIQAEAWLLLALSLLGAALGVYVYARFLTAAFRSGPATPLRRAALPETVVLLTGSALILGVGIQPDPLDRRDPRGPAMTATKKSVGLTRVKARHGRSGQIFFVRIRNFFRVEETTMPEIIRRKRESIDRSIASYLAAGGTDEEGMRATLQAAHDDETFAVGDEVICAHGSLTGYSSRSTGPTR